MAWSQQGVPIQNVPDGTWASSRRFTGTTPTSRPRKWAVAIAKTKQANSLQCQAGHCFGCHCQAQAGHSQSVRCQAGRCSQAAPSHSCLQPQAEAKPYRAEDRCDPPEDEALLDEEEDIETQCRLPWPRWVCRCRWWLLDQRPRMRS